MQNPITFNEKINYLKLYDIHPEYSQLVDKWEVTTYVEEKIGKSYCVPKYGVYDSFDDIDFDSLPNQFVLKCTHDSGTVIICRDKSLFDKDNAKKVLEKSLKNNFYWSHREILYKNVKPRILCEKYLQDESGNGLIDYKFFCFDGQPKFMFIATGRANNKTCFDFFDMKFNWIPVQNHYPNAKDRPQKPKHFEEMIELACKLSSGIKHVRVDFFECDGRVYFGEMTFVHFGGVEKFEPEEYDCIFGDYLTI